MTSRFDILETPIPALKLIQRKPHKDVRGYLERLFCLEELQPLVLNKNITQINHTLTARKGTVRGLHFQNPPHAETKFISCLRGKVFDVAVDVRHSSPTFLKWHAEILSAKNHKTLAIPEGFAHGFQALTANCEMLYFHTANYHPESEKGLHAQDPRLAIKWPLTITELSERDSAYPMIGPDFTGVPA
ncbi:MAG: dTDP-4-dehydrorhamnose 3,5-epimerase family protein [Candidatus Omnitrophota bacterium]